MFLITMIVFRIFHHRGYRPCYIIYRLQPTKLFSNKEPLANLYMEEWKMAKYNLIAKIDDTTVENFNKLGQRIVLFQPPVTDAGLASNTYSVKNNMAELPMLTFGLAQDIIANGVEL